VRALVIASIADRTSVASSAIDDISPYSGIYRWAIIARLVGK
jgi:hypothetical protein